MNNALVADWPELRPGREKGAGPKTTARTLNICFVIEREAQLLTKYKRSHTQCLMDQDHTKPMKWFNNLISNAPNPIQSYSYVIHAQYNSNINL